MKRTSVLFVVPLLLLTHFVLAAEGGKVTTLRVPQGGIQPQAAVDAQGGVHLIYYRGDAGGGDLFYVHSANGLAPWSEPIPVNRHARDAVAMGNIRGAHLALGKNGRPHVAWMGSKFAPLKAPDGGATMLYTRLADDGKGFEEERGVIQSSGGLDGGGSLAADVEGRVYVAWHGTPPETKGEDARRVFVARSNDEGRTFAPERAAFEQPTGACGCCGMRAFADRKGNLYLLYRSAQERVNRDMYLLTSQDQGATTQGVILDRWSVGQCVMSSAALSETPGAILAAWETRGQILFSKIDPAGARPAAPIAAPAPAAGRKYPAVAGNTAGEVILAWTEGMGWQKGGAVAWQLFDAKGQPTEEKGRAEGVPAWSLVAVFVRADGGFTVVY